MTLFTRGDGNTQLSPEERDDLIPDLTTKEELNEWERQNILEASAWALNPRNFESAEPIFRSLCETTAPKVFSVEGPMSSDESWNEAVCNAQSKGRSVHCFSVHGQTDRTTIEKSYSAQSSFTAKQPGTMIVFDHLLD